MATCSFSLAFRPRESKWEQASLSLEREKRVFGFWALASWAPLSSGSFVCHESSLYGVLGGQMGQKNKNKKQLHGRECECGVDGG